MVFLGELVLQTACKGLTSLDSAFLAAARDLILNQTSPSCPANTNVKNKIFKNPSKDQQKEIDTEFPNNCFSLQYEIKECPK